jgi:hypothetical protein
MNSPAGIAESLYDDTGELLQIFGTLLLNDGEKKTLYINKLSDFALCVELGLPIRFFHREGKNSTDLSKAIEKLQKDYPRCLKFNVNKELLDFYMQAVSNVNLSEYCKKLGTSYFDI